jgi:hypothetical protein
MAMTPNDPTRPLQVHFLTPADDEVGGAGQVIVYDLEMFSQLADPVLRLRKPTPWMRSCGYMLRREAAALAAELKADLIEEPA